MKKYLVQTGWITEPFRTPEFKGDIEVLATSKEVAMLSLKNNKVFLCPVIKEISAKDLEGTKLMPKSNIPYMGIMNLIAN